MQMQMAPDGSSHPLTLEGIHSLKLKAEFKSQSEIKEFPLKTNSTAPVISARTGTCIQWGELTDFQTKCCSLVADPNPLDDTNSTMLCSCLPWGTQNVSLLQSCCYSGAQDTLNFTTLVDGTCCLKAGAPFYLAAEVECCSNKPRPAPGGALCA